VRKKEKRWVHGIEIDKNSGATRDNDQIQRDGELLNKILVGTAGMCLVGAILHPD